MMYSGKDIKRLQASRLGVFLIWGGLIYTAVQRNRPDHDGTHRLAFERNKKRIMASENVCGICGQLVDKKLKYPDPMSPCIDHIIPIDRGGHPSDIANLQLAHWKCNRAKSNKLIIPVGGNKRTNETVSMENINRILPLSMDWKSYRAKTGV